MIGFIHGENNESLITIMSVKSQSKKEDLLRVAGEIFFRQGFAATGVKQIIDEVGIAKGTFYFHFSSKEEIGIAWLKAANDNWNAAMAEKLDKANSPRDKIIALFSMLEDWIKTSDYRGCAFLNSLAELPQPEGLMREVVREHKESLRAEVVGLTRAHFSDKSKVYADHKAYVIYLLFEAALVESQNSREDWPVKTVHQELLAILS